MSKRKTAKQPPVSAQTETFKFKIGDKVKIDINDFELDDCVKSFRMWLRENKYQGVIDDIAENVNYPYLIEGHDFKESELTLIKQKGN